MIGRSGNGWIGRKSAWSALSLMVVFAAACTTADPGARNTLGNVTAALPATPTEVIAATERALRQMDVTIIASNATAVDGRVTARSPRRRPVDVRVVEDVDNHSRVSVRVGAFGDEDVSIGLLRRIRRELERDPRDYEGFEYRFEQRDAEEPDDADAPSEAGDDESVEQA